jgi:hypothetical protein
MENLLNMNHRKLKKSSLMIEVAFFFMYIVYMYTNEVYQ